MRYVELADGAAFLDLAGAFLERREAMAGPILGVASMSGPRLLAAVVDAEGRPRLAAARLPGRKLVIFGAGDAAAVLADGLRAAGQSLPSVIGPADESAAFAAAWAHATGGRAERSMALGVYELRRVEHRGEADGALRVADARDVELLTDWAYRFTRDAGVDLDQDRASLRVSVARKIERSHLFIWEDGGPVSSAGLARPTRSGITVNAVFTPAALRGRGYATSCVAALSQRALDEGRAFCTLLTDLANPTSNAIYRRIGYRPVGEQAEYDFHHVQ